MELRLKASCLSVFLVSITSCFNPKWVDLGYNISCTIKQHAVYLKPHKQGKLTSRKLRRPAPTRSFLQPVVRTTHDALSLATLLLDLARVKFVCWKASDAKPFGFPLHRLPRFPLTDHFVMFLFDSFFLGFDTNMGSQSRNGYIDLGWDGRKMIKIGRIRTWSFGHATRFSSNRFPTSPHDKLPS